MRAEGAEGIRAWRTFQEAVLLHQNEELRQLEVLNQDQMRVLGVIDRKIDAVRDEEATRYTESLDNILKLYDQLGRNIKRHIDERTEDIKGHVKRVSNAHTEQILEGIKTLRTESMGQAPAPKRRIVNIPYPRSK